MSIRVVRINAFSSARKEKVEQTSEDSFDVYVREPAQRNMANRRIREVVALVYGIDISTVQIVAGHQSRKKTIHIID